MRTPSIREHTKSSHAHRRYALILRRLPRDRSQRAYIQLSKTDVVTHRRHASCSEIWRNLQRYGAVIMKDLQLAKGIVGPDQIDQIDLIFSYAYLPLSNRRADCPPHPLLRCSTAPPRFGTSSDRSHGSPQDVRSRVIVTFGRPEL
jgi:hypothetical protein